MRTNTEFCEAQMKIQDEISAAKTALSELRSQFIAQAPHQIGDRVLVTHSEKGKPTQTVFFISEVNLPYFFRFTDPETETFSYNFSKPKKDGTPSLNKTYISSVTKIEKA